MALVITSETSAKKKKKTKQTNKKTELRDSRDHFYISLKLFKIMNYIAYTVSVVHC